MQVGHRNAGVRWTAVGTEGLVIAAGLVVSSVASGSAAASGASGIHKIKHVVIIMQENRSFDSYFGTYPGADGIPMKHGAPSVCNPDRRTGQCAKPNVDHADVNGGGPHSRLNATADINGGQMNGFVNQARQARRDLPVNPE